MKIAIIDQRYNRFLNDRVLGGSEMVVKTHVTLFAMHGHQVIFITSQDSEEFPHENVKTCRVNSLSYFMSDQSKKYTKTRAQEISSIISRECPDVIFCHDNMNSSLAGLINDIPFFSFVHDSAGISGLISIGYINSYIGISDISTVVHVSKKSMNNWNEFVQKTKMIDKKCVFDTYVWNAVMWDRFVVPDNIANRSVSMGRMIKAKNHVACSKYVENLTIFYPSIKSPKEQEIFDSVKRYGPTLIENEEHSKIMKFLSESKIMASFSTESFGLSAFEANSMGVPVLLCHKDKDHSFHEFCSGLYHFFDPKEASLFVKEFQPLSKKERQDISDQMYEKFNPRKAYDRLIALIENNQKQTSSLVEFLK